MHDELEFFYLVQDMFEEQHRRGMRHLISLLRKMEDPHAWMLQLLHVICERFPSVAVRDWDGKPIVFQVSCPCKTSHSVSHLGFLHLEEVEGVLGTAEQKVEKVVIRQLQDPWLSALSSRASRQHERWKWWKMVERLDACRLFCNRRNLEIFLSLVQNCH